MLRNDSTVRGWVSSSVAAKKMGFIYLLFAPTFGAIYIGQTRGSLGALGRFANHLSDGDGGTFRKRICTIFKFDDIRLEGVYFFAAPLTNNKSFHLDSSDYREAVEFHVQNHVLNYLTPVQKLVVLSRVSGNAYCELEYVKAEAKKISSQLARWLEKSIKEPFP